ncbi:S8 family peptidase [Paenibacillus sp. SC116]|uniref:S8 family peptidase n=1 Tax=Paenibacillus sp. SC116 TaxID=2968986 RepID=UPI00215A2F6F|nr:S8 family peptidase [Paenibacillus sp. SC116]MCR8843034.1 S8 family peptidase [Paenibacillus sp. SC116]
MRSLSAYMKAHIQSQPHKYSVRKMIVCRNREAYENWLHELHKQGITPLKQIPSALTICCHMNPDKELHTSSYHPSIRKVETDRLVRIHRWSKGWVRSSTSSPGAYSPTFTSKSMKEVKVKLPQIPWNIHAIEAPKVWKQTKGEGIKIAIIDTGISEHSNLKIAGGINMINRLESYEDDNGHGTHVAGIAAAIGHQKMPFGVAPDIQLYGIKALDNTGTGYVSDIIDAIEWCIQQRIHIINMSLGLDDPSDVLRRAIIKANQRGIIVVASAGNDGPDTLSVDEPAKYPETIAVAAMNAKYEVASFSSRGKEVDVIAPGELIISTNNKNGFAIESGTSMAAPHVAGAVALLLSLHGALNPDDVRRLLMNTAEPLKNTNERSQGSGLIQTMKAIQSTPQYATASGRSFSRRVTTAYKLEAARSTKGKPNYSRPIFGIALSKNMKARAKASANVNSKDKTDKVNKANGQAKREKVIKKQGQSTKLSTKRKSPLIRKQHGFSCPVRKQTKSQSTRKLRYRK